MGGWASQVMVIEESTCGDKHCVAYINNESLNTTSKTNALYGG